MPIQNSDVSEIFNKVAILLELEGANQFRIRAYRSAARVVADLPQSIADMVKREEDLSELPGIGKDLAGKIKEIAKTGTLGQLKELEEKTPSELSVLMKIEGLGPKRVMLLHKKLGIETPEEMREAAKAQKIREISGFGQKTEQIILEGLGEIREEKKRIKLMAAEQIATPLVDYLKKSKGIKEIEVAGSYRRRKETIGDLDILVTCKKNSNMMDRFVDYEDVEKVISKGKTRSTVALQSGFHVDLRVVPQVCYGSALHYFTGSKNHNIAVRSLGVKQGLKINEYGVFKGKKEKRIAGRTEEEVYKQVGLSYIEPELRENRGEIEAAKKGKLHKLITLKDIRGDLHVHTKETDGRHGLDDMVKAAKNHGYEYLAITDHSKRVSMSHGLDKKRLAKQIKAIDKLNGKMKGIVILKSVELDILEDGSLDLPDDILKELDFTICAVHYNTKLSRKKQTERIIRAMDNPFFNILAHPSGRIINEREPYDLDLERLMEAAKERGCLMELNAHPDRLDLTDRYCKKAKEMEMKIVISTDAHSTTDLDFMRFGVDQARRGWLIKGDVLNTRTLKGLKELLRRK
ncbi:MAG TPA: DNA polymerase/3'-5' exonuclease PolX [Syntrophales bacterium]|nr:DNA polymerase/3'-5' exonuclease PolX [Syntrophales bacterium]